MPEIVGKAIAWFATSFLVGVAVGWLIAFIEHK